MTKKTSDPKDKAPLPTILTLTFKATVEGWKQFSTDASVADAAGYDLLGICPLGTSSFGAVWKMARFTNVYPDFLGVEDDDAPLADEG